jgi:cobalt-zinc-cadmium efflux system outer membrane protein
VSAALVALRFVITPSFAEGAPDPAPGPEARADALLADPTALASWIRERNPDVGAAIERVEQSRADFRASRLHPNPSLNAGLSDVTVGATNPPGLAFSDTAIYGLTLSETVEIGKRGPRAASAWLRLGAEHESYLAALNEATGDARYALGRIAYLRAKTAALEESLSAARQVLDLQRSRLENGDLSGNDHDRLLVDTMLLESDVTQNRSEYEAALAACRAVLRAPCAAGAADLQTLAAAVVLPEGLAPAEAPSAEPPLGERPDLRALDLTRDSAREDARLARRRAIPDPVVALGYTRDRLTLSGDQPRALSFGVTLPLPIFDHGQQDAQKADHRAAELEDAAAALRERARSAIKALLEREATLENTLAALVGEALPRSKSVLDSTLSAFSQGELSMTDLLLARRTHNDLALRVMDLQFELFTTRSELRRALGLDAELARQAEGESWKTR